MSGFVHSPTNEAALRGNTLKDRGCNQPYSMRYAPRDELFDFECAPGVACV